MASPSPPLLSAYPDMVVVGAGMGGLSFVLSLLHHIETNQLTFPPTFRVRLLERDETATSVRASQGYTLSIRCDAASGGVQVLDQLRLMEEAESEATPSQGMAICNAAMHPLVIVPTSSVPSVSRPGVMCSSCRLRRYVLRELLLRAVESRAKQGGYKIEVQFNSGVASATEITIDGGEPKVELTLLNGKRVTCDLLIAADGSNSKIRDSISPSDRITFNGAYGIGGEATFNSEASSSALRAEALPQMLQDYHVMASDGIGHSVFLAAVDSRRALWFVAERRKTEPNNAGRSKEEVFTEALLMGSRFAEPLPTLLAHTAVESVSPMNCKDKLPTSNAGLPTSRVILIGDAAHAISPFAGNGANMAIMDGFDLARVLIEARTADLAAAISRYDSLSLPRNKRALNFSHQIIRSAHSTGMSYYANNLLLRVLGIALRHQQSIKYGAIVIGSVSLIAGVLYTAVRW